MSRSTRMHGTFREGRWVESAGWAGHAALERTRRRRRNRAARASRKRNRA